MACIGNRFDAFRNAARFGPIHSEDDHNRLNARQIAALAARFRLSADVFIEHPAAAAA